MAKFISNNANNNHEDILLGMFSNAENIDWQIAFVSQSGIRAIDKKFKKFLKEGNSARVMIGLDYYHTDPAALDYFYDLSQKYHNRMKFFIGKPNRECVFHPKTYVFYYTNQDGEKYARVLIGSANLTSGGLGGNYEFSTRLRFNFDENGDSDFLSDLEAHVKDIIEAEEVVPATSELIEKYRIEHHFNKMYRKISERKTNNSIGRTWNDYYALVLQEFKNEAAPDDFHSQIKNREVNRMDALNILKNISFVGTWSASDFLGEYSKLVSLPLHLFHSSMIGWGKKGVVGNRNNFVKGLRALENFLSSGPVTAEDAYNALLKHFNTGSVPSVGVHGAGVNAITEILHSYDPNRYAVMNTLSVEHLRKVSPISFPSLNKKFITGQDYQDFCDEADKLCKTLGLKNFTEFDALMNYDHW